MLDITGKILPLGSGMAPRLEVNLLPKFGRETLGPFAAWIMFVYIFHGIGMDVILVSAQVIWFKEKGKKRNETISCQSTIQLRFALVLLDLGFDLDSYLDSGFMASLPNCVASWISKPTAWIVPT